MIEIRNFAADVPASQSMDKLLGNRYFLLIVAIWETDIHLRALTRRKGRNVLRRFAKPDQTANRFINREDGTNAIRLELNSLTVNNFGGRDDRFKDDVALLTAVDNERLELAASDLDRHIATVVNVDLLLWIGDLDSQHGTMMLFPDRVGGMILNHPLVPTILILKDGKTSQRFFLLFRFG